MSCVDLRKGCLALHTLTLTFKFKTSTAYILHTFIVYNMNTIYLFMIKYGITLEFI